MGINELVAEPNKILGGDNNPVMDSLSIQGGGGGEGGQ